MKLSNYQIDALTNKLRSEHSIKKDVEIKEIKKKYEKQALSIEKQLIKAQNILNKLPTSFKRTVLSTKDVIINSLASNEIALLKTPNFRDLILIASIDSVTLEDLSRKLNIKL